MAEQKPEAQTGLEIQIKVRGLPTKPIQEFENFQGNLKTLDKTSLAKLKASIVRNGFNAPVFVWKDHNYILDGHQRITAVKHLIDKDGMTLAGNALPYVDIEASSEKQAKEMILTYNSQYGDISSEALADLLQGIELPAESLKDFVELPQIDLQEVMWHMRDTPEFQIVKRDMESSEQQYLASQGAGNSIWGVSKAYVRFGRYYFFINHDMAEELGQLIKDKGPKWLISLLKPELTSKEIRTIGPLFVLPLVGAASEQAKKAAKATDAKFGNQEEQLPPPDGMEVETPDSSDEEDDEKVSDKDLNVSPD